jgi:hypothetical protein
MLTRKENLLALAKDLQELRDNDSMSILEVIVGERALKGLDDIAR